MVSVMARKCTWYWLIGTIEVVEVVEVVEEEGVEEVGTDVGTLLLFFSSTSTVLPEELPEEDGWLAVALAELGSGGETA